VRVGGRRRRAGERRGMEAGSLPEREQLETVKAV